MSSRHICPIQCCTSTNRMVVARPLHTILPIIYSPNHFLCLFIALSNALRMRALSRGCQLITHAQQPLEAAAAGLAALPLASLSALPAGRMPELRRGRLSRCGTACTLMPLLVVLLGGRAAALFGASRAACAQEHNA